MRAIEGPGAQYDLFPGVDDPDLAVPLELDPVGGLGLGVDHDLGHHGLHGDVEVLAVPNGTQERLGGAATGTAPQRTLGNHEARLVGTVAIPVFVAGKKRTQTQINMKISIFCTLPFRSRNNFSVPLISQMFTFEICQRKRDIKSSFRVSAISSSS